MLTPLQRRSSFIATLLVFITAGAVQAQDITDIPAYIRKNYTRQDYQVPMRDGARLYTIVYSPKDQSQKYPILMMRTPYSVVPYNKTTLRGNLGPNRNFVGEGYIFVYQDVRGCYMSE